jgi:hypothetical protein
MKNAICCVPLVPPYCGVLNCTPHSSELRVPCIWTFLIDLNDFLETCFRLVVLAESDCGKPNTKD